MIEPGRRGNGLGVTHYAGMAVIGVVGGVLALLLFIWVVGAVFRIVEIAAVIVLIGLAIRFLIGRARR